MAKEVCQWFIEPLDAHTNEVIANELLRRSIFDGASFELRDKGGAAHQLFYVPAHHYISDFSSARQKFGLKFKVWRRFSDNETIKLWTFERQSNPVKREAKPSRTAGTSRSKK
jgi:hypothetical protein